MKGKEGHYNDVKAKETQDTFSEVGQLAKLGSPSLSSSAETLGVYQ
jgi:hypothetical protein